MLIPKLTLLGGRRCEKSVPDQRGCLRVPNEATLPLGLCREGVMEQLGRVMVVVEQEEASSRLVCALDSKCWSFRLSPPPNRDKSR